MHAGPLLVAWHNDKAPVYSAHFQPHGRGGRLATAGGDNNIRLWTIEAAAGEERKVTYLATLSKHAQAVNVVRWSPRDDTLASAGDDGTVIMWAQSDFHSPTKFGEEDLDDKETWMARRQCRSNTSHEYGIYDLAWSPDGAFFVTGSTDNVARIYDALTGNVVRQIAEHNHYVQGVAWDPLNEYLATQSSDRSVHIYKLQTSDGHSALGQPSLYSRMARMDLPARRPSSSSPAPPDFGHRALLAAVSTGESQSHHNMSPAPSTPGTPTTAPLPMNPPPPTHSRKTSNSLGNLSPAVHRSPSPAPSMPLPAIMQASPSQAAAGLAFRNTNIYANEALTSFFRRLTFSPDGSLLFTPAGQYKVARPSPSDQAKMNEEILNTVYIYSRAGLNKPPIAHLPGHRKASVAVRCSPVLYELRLPISTKHVTIDTSSSTAEAITPLPGPAIPSRPASTPSTAMDPPPPSLPASTSSNGQTDALPKTPQQSSDAKTAPDGPPPAFSLPYRVVYAVATQDTVFVYDTQQQTPLCVVSNLHFATFTDLTWSSDGLTLLMSSTDGFCSSLGFAQGELGTTYQGTIRTRSHKPTPISVANSNVGTPLSTPLPMPTIQRAPSAGGGTPVAPNPTVPTIPSVRPASPTRSNSASSIATQSSFAPQGVVISNPTPSLSNLPSVAASGSKAFTVPPALTAPTPPLTPLPHLQHHNSSSAAPAASPGGVGGTVGGSGTTLKRDEDASREPDGVVGTKKRRVVPTLVEDTAIQVSTTNPVAPKAEGEAAEAEARS